MAQKRFRITREELRTVQERLRVVGMHCTSCAITIENRLKKLPGVKSVRVNFATGEALIEYDLSRVKLRDIVRAVRDAGYDTQKAEVILRVRGLASHDDEVILEDKLLSTPGVIEALASRATATVRIVYNPTTVSQEDLKRVVEEAGFTVEGVVRERLTVEAAAEAARAEVKRLSRLVLVCLPLGLTYAALFYMSLLGALHLPAPVMDLLGAVVSGFILAYGGRSFFLGAYRSLRNRSAGMDLLVSLGTGSAYVYSLAVLGGLVEGTSFFEAPALIVPVVLLGRLIEARARLAVGTTSARLLSLQPPRARVVRGDGVAEVPLSSVRVGDVVEVRAGERVPVDGIVIEGRAAVDESVFTGEPIPVARGPGDRVLAGSLVVEGYVRVRVTRVGSDTLLAQMAKLVEYAQTAKPSLQRVADKVAGFIAWVAIAVAATAFIYWYLVAGQPLSLALMLAVSVLVVACPCALGLASPLAVAAGLWRAAEHGIVVKNVEAIEKSPKLTVVVFDKTGTLTEGRPQVAKIVAEGVEEDELLELAAGAESRSSHPVAKAIVSEAVRRGVKVPAPDEFESIPGHGVVARVNGRLVVVGNEKLMKGMEVDVEPLKHHAEKLMEEGYTVVYVAVDGRVVGIIAITDTVREGAVKAVRELKRMGLRVAMLTGDSRRAALAIARRLGIDEVIAEAAPDEKADRIRQLQRRGHVVAMVGDGVNDAPSLAQADIGVAVGSGTDLAKEAGDVVLVSGDVYGVVTAIRTLRAIYRKIVENLVWAFAYNTALIPIAAGILYPHLVLRPEMAAAAMAASSVSVTLNALRLAPRRSIRSTLRRRR
jgi:heavy metal translocating P-type ATPase